MCVDDTTFTFINVISYFIGSWVKVSILCHRCTLCCHNKYYLHLEFWASHPLAYSICPAEPGCDFFWCQCTEPEQYKFLP